MVTASDIIDRLGGTSAVAIPLGLTPSVVHSWRGTNSIPRWRHGEILALAIVRGVALSTADFPQRDQRISRAAA